jgi:hypothetical protein
MRALGHAHHPQQHLFVRVLADGAPPAVAEQVGDSREKGQYLEQGRPDGR